MASDTTDDNYNDATDKTHSGDDATKSPVVLGLDVGGQADESSYEAFIHAGDDIESGPSGLQLQVPEHVQQALCGDDDPPSLSEYEKLRERNIREREEAMKEAMVEIQEAKQDMTVNGPRLVEKRKTGKEFEEGKKRRKKSEEVAVEVRRSGRVRKPVTYVLDEDLDGKSMKRRAEVSDNRLTSSVSHDERKGRSELRKSVPIDQVSSSALQSVDYAEIRQSEADCFIWCSTCGTEEYNGCEKHATVFGDSKMFSLEVYQSIAEDRNEGGVFSRSKVINEGSLFGPYTGNFIHAAEYKKVEKAAMELGNAWGIQDKDNYETVGYIGTELMPDSNVHWMSKVNCACTDSEQNLVGFQLAGQVYYRATMDINIGRELLVFYGETYARGIEMKVDSLGKGDESKEAIEYCKKALEVGEELEIQKNSRERLHICEECGKGFSYKSGLLRHVASHNKFKGFKCEVKGCENSYHSQSSLTRHKKTADYQDCPECGYRLCSKDSMNRHFKSVHLKVKPCRCPTCERHFPCKSDLARHVKSFHEE